MPDPTEADTAVRDAARAEATGTGAAGAGAVTGPPGPPRSPGSVRHCPASSRRARATRERTVPTGQPAASAALLVGEPHHLGEHEGLAARRVQVAQGVEDRDRLVESGEMARLGPLRRALPVGGVGGPGAYGGRAVAVDDDAPGDGEEPGAGAGASGEAGEAAHGPYVGLLGEVVGAGDVGAEVGDEPPDVLVGRPDEAVGGLPVAATGGQGPVGDLPVVLAGAVHPGPGRGGRRRRCGEARSGAARCGGGGQ